MVVRKNLGRSAVFKILRPARLAPTTIASSKSLKSPFSPILMLGLNFSRLSSPHTKIQIKLRWALFVTYTIIQSIMRSEMCSLHLTHPSTHTWSSEQPTLRRPGSSWGFGALSKVHLSCGQEYFWTGVPNKVTGECIIFSQNCWQCATPVTLSWCCILEIILYISRASADINFMSPLTTLHFEF